MRTLIRNTVEIIIISGIMVSAYYMGFITGQHSAKDNSEFFKQACLAKQQIIERLSTEKDSIQTEYMNFLLDINKKMLEKEKK